MARQGVGTILSTIGDFERLQTGTAERLAGKQYADDIAAQEARLKAEQETLNKIAEVEASESNLPPKMTRSIQQMTDQLYEKIRGGELDLMDINQEVNKIKSTHNAYKNTYEQFSPKVKLALEDPQGYQALKEEDGVYIDVSDEVLNTALDSFFGEGVWDEESSLNLMGSLQALQKYESIKPKDVDESIKSFYDMNKSDESLQLEGVENAQQFFEKVTRGGLNDDARERLFSYLKEEYRPELVREATRRKGIADDQVVDMFARELFLPRIPQEQVERDVEQNDVYMSQFEFGLGQAKDKPVFEASSGIIEFDSGRNPFGFPPSFAEGDEDFPITQKKVIATSITQKSGKPAERPTLDGVEGRYGDAFFNPNTEQVAFNFVPVIDSEISTKVPIYETEEDRENNNPKTTDDGKILYKETRVKEKYEAGDKVQVYVDLESGENKDLLETYLKQHGMNLEDYYKMIGYNPKTGGSKAQESTKEEKSNKEIQTVDDIFAE